MMATAVFTAIGLLAIWLMREWCRREEERWAPLFAAQRGETCLTCEAFSYCDPDDVDECDGYCIHPNNGADDSPNRMYGGHWTTSASWCAWWTRAEADEIARRSAVRAAAVEKSQADPAVARTSD